MSLLGRNTSPAHQPARTLKLTKDPAGTPAVNLTKVREAGHDALAKKADKAGLALSKQGVAGIRAQVVVILDHSGSMHADYASGAVQLLVERALGFALQVDADGVVPVVPFDHRVLPAVHVGIADDPARSVLGYQGVVNSRIWRNRDMGTTDLAGALGALRGFARAATDPIFAIVVTDGEPDNTSLATQAVCDLAGYPVFIKFLAVKPVAYLTQLDDLDSTRRLVDNVDAKPEKGSGLNLLTCSDMQFADACADEWATWITAATAAGVLS